MKPAKPVKPDKLSSPGSRLPVMVRKRASSMGLGALLSSPTRAAAVTSRRSHHQGTVRVTRRTPSTTPSLELPSDIIGSPSSLNIDQDSAAFRHHHLACQAIRTNDLRQVWVILRNPHPHLRVIMLRRRIETSSGVETPRYASMRWLWTMSQDDQQRRTGRRIDSNRTILRKQSRGSRAATRWSQNTTGLAPRTRTEQRQGCRR